MTVRAAHVPAVRPQFELPLVALAAASVALLLVGLATSAALGGVLPSPFGDATAIETYFKLQPSSVRMSAVFAFASAIPLALYAAAVGSRLRALGATGPGAAIALGAGLISATVLSLSGMLQWVLSRPAVVVDAPVLHALSDLSFLTGGVAHVVFLGLLVAGIAMAALQQAILPRRLVLIGPVIAVVAVLSTMSLTLPAAAFLLPIARFPALIWLVVVGWKLPRALSQHDPAAAIATLPSTQRA
jgi:hypothetical protein